MDEDDLKWVANYKNILLSLKQFHKNVCTKTPMRRKFSHFSEMRYDALMRCESLTLLPPDCLGLFFIHLKLELLTQFPAPNDEK